MSGAREHRAARHIACVPEPQSRTHVCQFLDGYKAKLYVRFKRAMFPPWIKTSPPEDGFYTEPLSFNDTGDSLTK